MFVIQLPEQTVSENQLNTTDDGRVLSYEKVKVRDYVMADSCKNQIESGMCGWASSPEQYRDVPCDF